MDLELLDDTLAARDQPPFRARQVWEWAARGVAGYDEMTNLPAALRAELADAVPFSTLTVEDEAHAADGTVKALFRTADGHPVEAVLMRYRDGRRSICVSSQSGCPLTCTFCATGAMRFGRNLRASEILDQVLHFRRIEPVNHLVFMGMGEPFLNFDEVLAAARRLPDDRDHAPAHDDLDGRLDARPDALRRRGRGADPARALDPRGRPAPPLASSCRSTTAIPCRASSPSAAATSSSAAARCSSST